MPMTVPEWQSSPSLPVPSLAGGSGTGAAGRIYGQALERLGAAGSDSATLIEQVRQHQRDTDAMIQRIEAVTGASAEIAAAGDAAAQDPDYATAGERFAAAADAVAKRWGEPLADPKNRALFDQHIAELKMSQGQRLGSRAIQMRSDRGVAALDEQAAQLSRGAAAGTEADAELARATIGASLADARDTGLITAEDAGKRLRGYDSNVAEARALAMIRQDPVAAKTALLDPRSPTLAKLDPVRRERLVERAQTEADSRAAQARADAERHDRLAEQALTRQKDETGKTLFQLSDQGALTETWLNANRGKLSKEDYRAGLKALHGDAETESVKVKRDLTIRAYGNDDIAPDAAAALQRGEIKSETYRQLVSDNRRYREENGAGSDWNTQMEWVVSQIPASTLTGAMFESAMKLQGQAKLMMKSWRSANPNADAAAMHDAGLDTLRRLGKQEQLPFPYGMSGRPDNIDQVNASADRILEDLKAGRLQKQQASDELQYVTAWRSKLAREALTK